MDDVDIVGENSKEMGRKERSGIEHGAGGGREEKRNSGREEGERGRMTWNETGLGKLYGEIE
jgi:hypothetical protein